MNSTTICNALIASGCVLGLSGCDSREESPSAQTPQAEYDQSTPENSEDYIDNDWDDADRDTKSTLDQSESSEHIRVTADIRQAIIADDSLSMGAKNCKVITDNSGRVWLRGEVESVAEKDLIEQIAKQYAGVNTVTNELEVDPG